MKALLLLLVCSVAHAGTVKFQVTLSPAGDFVAQSAKGRGFIEKNGSDLTASELSVEVGTLKTDIELRDKHLHERLGGVKSKITLKNAKGSGGKGTGTLTANGQSKPVSFNYKESNGQVVARFAIQPSDFGIKDVKYLGIGVEDKVVVDVQFPVR